MIHTRKYDPVDELDLEWIDTEERDLDGESIIVRNAYGFGGCDVQIEGSIITWKQLDKLKKAIAEAERLWRKEEE